MILDRIRAWQADDKAGYDQAIDVLCACDHALDVLAVALAAHDANQREHEPFVAEWTYVEAVITPARALVGVPLEEDAVSEQLELPALTIREADVGSRNDR